MENGWQPPSTIPLDGTIVDLWIESRGRNACRFISRPASNTRKKTVAGRAADMFYNPLAAKNWKEAGWYSCNDSSSSIDMTETNILAWMPVPGAPFLTASVRTKPSLSASMHTTNSIF